VQHSQACTSSVKHILWLLITSRWKGNCPLPLNFSLSEILLFTQLQFICNLYLYRTCVNVNSCYRNICQCAFSITIIRPYFNLYVCQCKCTPPQPLTHPINNLQEIDALTAEQSTKHRNSKAESKLRKEMNRYYTKNRNLQKDVKQDNYSYERKIKSSTQHSMITPNTMQKW